MLAEKALAAERLHIDCHTVSRMECGDCAAHLLYHANHLMADSDTRHRPGNGAMLNMQIAGANTAERHPYNGIAVLLQYRNGLLVL